MTKKFKKCPPSKKHPPNSIKYFKSTQALFREDKVYLLHKNERKNEAKYCID